MPLRPDFLGARHSGDIFLEFFTLSRITELRVSNYDHNLSTDIEDWTSANAQADVQAIHKTDQSTQSVSRLNVHGASAHSIETTVIERHMDKSETLVNYKFTDKTENLFEKFNSLNIPYQTEIYKPKEERLHAAKNIFYCKNLFLKDRKGQFYLVICHEDLNIDLKVLRKHLDAYRNFNFGNANDMAEILGVEPGGVTPLALMLPSAVNVKMVIHKSLLIDDSMWMFHPLDSNLATKLSPECLLRFLKHFNHPVKIVK